MKFVLFILNTFIVSITACYAQEAQSSGDNIPSVTFSQGKIIGSLPYGTRFFMRGSTRLPNGGFADAVTLQIRETGHRKLSRSQEIPTNILSSETGLKPVVSSTWISKMDVDTTHFNLYIDHPLKFWTQYLVKVTFSKKLVLSKIQIQEIMNRITTNIDQAYISKNGVTLNEIKNIVLTEVSNAQSILDSFPSQWPGSFNVGSRSNPIISSSVYDDLSKNYGRLANSMKRIAALDSSIMVATTKKDLILEQLQQEKNEVENRINGYKNTINIYLNSIRTSFVDAYVSYSLSTPDAYLISEINTINMGTAIGVGLVGLNFPTKDQRSRDVFGYVGVKFYLLPVDKRIFNPYLVDRHIINRLSVLVGLSVKGDLRYKGSPLEKPLGFYPMLGLSCDLNRYLTIDLGMTMFKQESLSPLNNNSIPKIAPVLGLNLDVDGFNRLKSLIQGDVYKINP